jgi:UPF0271 protein
MTNIDINCDMGESYGQFKIGNDEALFPFIQSCNIACGFHGGDPLHIENTIKNALKHNVKIGAHPSYPDLAGFGRRKMTLEKAELKAILKYQIAAVKGMTESLGGQLAYVKPHGALYNSAANNEEETLTIMEALREIDVNLKLMGLAGSITEKVAKEQNFPFIAEAFGDRKYTDDGQLMSRSKTGAVIENSEEAVAQIWSISQKNQVISESGKILMLAAQSICIHGDNVAALTILKALQKKIICK